jgi:hypothetical protein
MMFNNPLCHELQNIDLSFGFHLVTNILEMEMCKYVSPQIMTFYIQKWHRKDEFIDFNSTPIPTKNTHNLSILCLLSNLEGILNF